MRKVICFVLIFCLITSFGVTQVSAVECKLDSSRQPLTDEEFDALIADAFPEYAERILNPQRTSSTFSLPNNIKVIDETRHISDTEHITYTEYADGRGSVIFQTDVYQSSTSSGSNSTTKVVDFQVRHRFMTGSMYISGFTYTIVHGLSQYDYINSKGTFTCTAENGQYMLYNDNENATADAEVRAMCIFNMSNIGDFQTVSPTPCTFQIIVGNDTISYNAY